MVVQTMLPLMQREGSRLVLAQRGDLLEVAHLSVFLQVSTIMGGLIGMLTQPLYGAIADAHARGDHKWCETRLTQARRLGVLLAATVCVIGYFIGPQIMRGWLGAGIGISGEECFGFSLYFGVTLLIHVHHVFLLAEGRLRQAVAASALEIACMLGIFVLLPIRGAAHILMLMAGIQASTSLILTTWALRRVS